jgi:hypothetical protein
MTKQVVPLPQVFFLTCRYFKVVLVFFLHSFNAILQNMQLGISQFKVLWFVCVNITLSR